MYGTQKWGQNSQKMGLGYQPFHLKIWSVPFVGQNLKFSQIYVVGLEMPDTIQKELRIDTTR